MRLVNPAFSNAAAVTICLAVMGPRAGFGFGLGFGFGEPLADGGDALVVVSVERAGRTNRPATRPSPMATARMTTIVRARTAAPPRSYSHRCRPRAEGWERLKGCRRGGRA